MDKQSARGRSMAAILAGVAVVAAGAGLTTAPAQSVVVAGDCAEAYPVAELAPGQAVHGLTVSKGTTPEGFTGEVLGVLDEGIAPGLDMVMVELTDAATAGEIDEKGIWAGMSGSPVYAEDGRLIGAVAYGLAWGSSPVAGVTPYEEMDDYMAEASAPARVAVSDRTARTIAGETDVSARQAAEGFRRLPMPMRYSGISGARLTKVKKKGPDWFHDKGARAARLAGTTSSAAAVPADLVAGGNLGAAISYGTVTFGGVGTVTSVCNDRLIGFGHPMTWGGHTSLGMMPANALYVQEDLITGFKVANMGTPAGTIDQDRLSGISGDLGVLPEETDIVSDVTYGARSRHGESASLVPGYNADVTFVQLLSMHDVTIDSIQPGSERASFLVRGEDADGASFTFEFGDRYTSQWDIAFEGIWDVADVVWALSRMDGVRVDEVTTTAHVNDDTARWRLGRVQQRRGGDWVTVGRRSPVVTKVGRTLRLRANLRDSAGNTTRARLAVEVPARSRRGTSLVVSGGASTWSNAIWRAKTPAAVETALEERVRNDEVQAELRIQRRGRDLRTTDVSRPQSLVVRGSKWFEVLVRR
jgi:hypothetical protein